MICPKKVVTIQKRMEKGMSKFKHLNMLNVPAIHINSCISLVLEKYSEIKMRSLHRFLFRCQQDLPLESFTGKYAEKSPYYSGVRFFKRLPEEIKSLIDNKNKI